MNRYAVIGLGRFGIKVCEYLMQQGAEVLALDMAQDVVEEMKDKVTRAVILDATDEAALKNVGLKEFDTVIVGMGEHFEASVLVVALSKKLGIKKIVVKALTDLQGEILRMVGASQVVYPEDGEAYRLTRSLLEPNVLDHVKITESQSVIKMLVPEKFIGKDIAELNMRQKYNVTVLEVSRTEEGKETFETMPGPDFKFKTGDRMVIIGNKDSIQKFGKTFGE